jgi:hypothetical protein
VLQTALLEGPLSMMPMMELPPLLLELVMSQMVQQLLLFVAAGYRRLM